MGGLRIFSVGVDLVVAVKSFFKNIRASVSRKDKESFKVDVWIRQGCVMSPLIFNIYMDEILNRRGRSSTGIKWSGVWGEGAHMFVCRKFSAVYG